jgi:diaminopimelate decarboxylase/aspartate kinase
LLSTQADARSVASKWIVLKFGGTSVAGKLQWETIAALARARREEGCRVVLVCSAVAGVTDRLTALADSPASGEMRKGLLQIHRSLGRSLGVDEQAWLPEAEQRLDRCLHDLRQNPAPRVRAALLALGEWMSTRIGALYLRGCFPADWVDVREALTASVDSELSENRRWLAADCRPGADRELAGRWARMAPILITQGFIARTESGESALLGRGGSDTSAALLAGRLGAERLEIWTDVPGLFSADPRRIESARLLARVDYAEALEMAASGARVVHPRCIRAAAATRTPVAVRDLTRRDVAGTWIVDEATAADGIKAVTCRQDMAVILLQNLDARYQVGFLADVFDLIRRRGISVDLVATSETTTTVAVDCAANQLDGAELAALVGDLRGRCKVDLFADCVCVNLVGRGARKALPRLRETMKYFEERPLLMASQSANDLCLSLLVRRGDHELLLRNAHRELIPSANVGPGDPFGPRWDQIR